MIDYESPSARTLLALADRRSGNEAACCRLVFAHLGTAARVRSCLQDALVRHHLSDLQFATLVVLSESEPEPVPMAVLAGQTGVSRSAMTDALDKLEALGFAGRTRDRTDRRIIGVRVTAAGREKADQAMNDYLHAASHAAGCVEELEARLHPQAGFSGGELNDAIHMGRPTRAIPVTPSDMRSAVGDSVR